MGTESMGDVLTSFTALQVILALLAAWTGSAAAGAALVFWARAGDDMVYLRRRASRAVVERRWRPRN